MQLQLSFSGLPTVGPSSDVRRAFSKRYRFKEHSFPGTQGEAVKKLIKFIFLVIIVSAIAAVVASLVSKKKLAHMTDEEIRAYLASKLGGKVGEDQLGSIQDAVIAGVRRGADVGQTATEYVEEVEDAVADLSEVAKEAEDETVDVAKSIPDDAADDVAAASSDENTDDASESDA